ncbi:MULTISPECIES: hypothetical protein [Sphingobacterium]|uniref:hypothetical protein n=1 Tax=Sphingobacterium TaxID=28453 RepID=UPI00104DF355|nr:MULTISPECIES: hypothetical protein [Sphingobacterium]MCW2260713.1 hypothetical protein [Sphingobacterium kitahiroshimense]TCR09011.1 hypothetical protein EDF67_106176 [Sphingobacterium sp. JUb78]
MTAQSSEVFIYQGRIYSDAYNEPLSKYLCDNNLSEEFMGISSACWRGYTGTWEIINSKLYLTNFSGSMQIPKVKGSDKTAPCEFTKTDPLEPFGIKGVGLDYLFPDQKEVFAEWYSGEIKLGKGFVKSDHDNFETLYRKETFLKFKEGILIELRVVRNDISFRDRIPNYIKHIYESDGDDDFPSFQNDDLLVNKKPRKLFKERLYSILGTTLYTLLIFPFAVVQLGVIFFEYICDKIFLKIKN